MEQEDKNLHAQQPDEAQTPAKQPEPKGYEAYLSLFDLVRMLAVITLMFVFFFRVNGVSGSSMYPTLVDKDYLVLESNFLYRNARQGDIVVLYTPPFSDNDELLVKRVIAVGGQTVDIDFNAGVVYVDGKALDEPYVNAPVHDRENFEGKITVQITVAEDKITDITLLSAEDEEEYLSRAKRVIPAILEGQSPNVDAVSGATYSSTGILNAVKLALAKAAIAPAEEAAPEQAASEEVVEEAAPSEAAEPEETPVTAPTVEVVQPEEKSAVSAWFKEVWQQLFPAETPDDSEPEPASSAEALPTSEAALPPEETETEPETEGAAE